MRLKAWKTKPMESRLIRASARSLSWSMRRPLSPTSPRVACPGRRAGRAASTSRSHWVPSRPGSPGGDLEVDPVHSADEALAFPCCLISPGPAPRVHRPSPSSFAPCVSPVHFACLQPAEVSLKSERDSLEQEPAAELSGSSSAVRWTSRSRRSNSRRWASTMSMGSASPLAAAISLRWNSARSGFGQVTSLSHSVRRLWPAAVRA